MICCICKNPIQKGDSIAVFSTPLKSLDNNGNYDIFGDFFEHENKVHAQCFKLQNVKTLTPAISNSKVSNDMTKQFCSALREVGEDIDMAEINDFMAEHLEIADLSDLVSEWFRNRNGVV